MSDNTTSFLKVAFDMDAERASLLANAAEYIQAGRTVLSDVGYYRGAQRCLMATSRPYEDEADRIRALVEILHVFPAVHNVESLLISYWVPEVSLVGGTKSPAVLVILVKRSGAEALVFPYYQEEDTGTVVYDTSAEIDHNMGRTYPVELSHAFAVYAFSWKGVGSAPEILKWLYAKGHTIQFFGDWNMNNLDAKSHIPVSEHS